jgi:tetratricopeptide (TPR) repeat protein
LRRNEELTTEIQKVQELGGHWRAQWLAVYASFVNGDYDQAILQSSKLFDSPDSSEKSQAYEVKASLLAEAGRGPEAIALLQEGEQFDRLHGLSSAQATKLIGLAYLYYRRLDFRDSSTLALRAIELDESPQRLMESGTLQALAGNLPAAQACLHKAQNQPGIPRVQMVTERIAGEIQLAKSQPREALVHFRRAAELSRANESQHALARALTAAGFTEEAAAVLRATAEAPAQVLLDRWNAWPGLWADSLLRYLALPSRHKDLACDLLQKYTKLRNSSNSESMGREGMNTLVEMQTRCRTKTTHEMGE